MSTSYLSAVVPAALRDTAEGLVAPLLEAPCDSGAKMFSVPLVPLAGPSDAAPTHYGCNAAVPSDGETVVAAPTLVAALPGSAYQLTPVGEWDVQTRWVGWLAGLGLQPRVEVQS